MKSLKSSSGGRVIACIIVRMHSKRLPRKALADILGKPMTLRIIERLRLAKTIDEIVICTSTHPDDQILLEKAREWGVSAIAGSEEDVLARLILAADTFKADYVLRVTGDNVFTDSQIIDRMVQHHIETGSEYTRTNGLPIGVTAEVLSTGMLKRLHSLIDPSQTEYMMLFAFDPERFHCEVLDIPEGIRRPTYSLTIDFPADIELARKLYASLPDHEGGGPSLTDIIKALDEDPNYMGVAADAPVKMPAGGSITFQELLDMLDQRADLARRKYHKG